MEISGGGADPMQTDSGPIRACVRVGEMETWYLRWGRGAPVLFLARGPVEALPFRLEELVPPGHCLLRPTLPKDLELIVTRAGESFSQWLSGLLDGLGLETARFACEPELAESLESFLDQNPDRIEGPVLWTAPARAEYSKAPEMTGSPEETETGANPSRQLAEWIRPADRLLR